MENELSYRLKTAVDFLKENGYAKNDLEIARTIKVAQTSFCMSMKGDRVPTWGMLLNFCDCYPINFWWLKTGQGDMIGRSIREFALMQEIEALKQRISELEKQL